MNAQRLPGSSSEGTGMPPPPLGSATTSLPPMPGAGAGSGGSGDIIPYQRPPSGLGDVLDMLSSVQHSLDQELLHKPDYTALLLVVTTLLIAVLARVCWTLRVK